MDVMQQERRLKAQGLPDAARRASLHTIAFLDGHGEVSLESTPVARELLAEAGRFLRSGQTVSLRLFPVAGVSGSFAYVALRRQATPGAVLLVLGQEDLLAWETRVSIQEAIDSAGWRKGVVYLSVSDPAGTILAQAGELPQGEGDRVESLAGEGQDSAPALTRRRTGVGGEVMEVVAPFRLGERVVGEVRVGLDPGELDDLMGRNRLQTYLSTAMLALLGLLAVAILYRSQSRHHRKIEEMRDRLHQSDRLSALGRLAGVVAHEVRNPLNAISMAVQRLRREFVPRDEQRRDEFVRMTDLVRDEIRRIDRIVEDFLGLSRSRPLKSEPVSVHALIARMGALIEGEAASRSIEIRTSTGGPQATVRVDLDRIMQALLNIVRNAMEATPAAGGVISLGLRREGPEMACIEISDTGGGIAAEDLDRIFEAGYTTKEKGLGLGLSIAYEIIRLHGGEVRVHSRQGHGTTFSLCLPCQPSA
jgi:signal transduction histidine kinase